VTGVAFPLGFDARGRTAAASDEQRIAGMVEAVLLTAPGERVNRPDFGCGLGRLLFAPVDDAVIATAELTLRSGMQRWLGDVVDLGDVTIELDEAGLRVSVEYRMRATGRTASAVVERRA
jgi:phage baseplate assembly protein W